MLNGLCQEGIFLAQWKRARLVLVPTIKEGTQRSLDIDPLYIGHIRKEMEEKRAISDNQYGFRPGRSNGECHGEGPRTSGGGEERTRTYAYW